jgi:hypothetical protein
MVLEQELKNAAFARASSTVLPKSILISDAEHRHSRGAYGEPDGMTAGEDE